jgi:hypothetical protein
MATRTKSKGTVSALALQLIAGTNKHLGNMTHIMVQGSPLTPAQIVERLQSLVQLRTDVDAAKATAKAKLAVEKVNTPALRAFFNAYVTFVKAAFDNTPDALADFGVHPKARVPLTAEAKTAAAAKRKATRAARHVMGAKQRKSVKGAVTGIVVTPVSATQPIAPATGSPSAPAASAGTTTAPPPHTT